MCYTQQQGKTLLFFGILHKVGVLSTSLTVCSAGRNWHFLSQTGMHGRPSSPYQAVQAQVACVNVAVMTATSMRYLGV